MYNHANIWRILPAHEHPIEERQEARALYEVRLRALSLIPLKPREVNLTLVQPTVSDRDLEASVPKCVQKKGQGNCTSRYHRRVYFLFIAQHGYIDANNIVDKRHIDGPCVPSPKERCPRARRRVHERLERGMDFVQPTCPSSNRRRWARRRRDTRAVPRIIWPGVVRGR